MKQATFSRPLKPKRTDFSFKSGVTDYKYIREHAAPNPFGIKPDEELKPLVSCSASKDCKNTYDPNTQTWSGGCAGFCSYG